MAENLPDFERINIFVKAGGEAADRIEALEGALRTIESYPPERGRRDEDGYPLEVTYDQFAHRRIVDAYREAARGALDPSDSATEGENG